MGRYVRSSLSDPDPSTPPTPTTPPLQPRDWSIKMNVKERRLALATAIQSAAADAIVVESLEGKLPEKKTKALVAALEKVGVPADKKCLLIVSKPYEHIMLAGRNVPHLAINTADAIRVFDVLNADKIVIEDAALQHIQSFYGGASSA